MDNYILSIIIINYNTFELTKKCINSVISNTSLKNYEIIVVDNASSECDPKLFLTFFPAIKLIESNLNLGFAKGNNLGIKNSQGEYILLLNSDTELINDAISIAYERINEDQNVGVVGARLYSPNGQIQHNCSVFPTVSNELYALLRLRSVFPERVSRKFLKSSLDYSYEQEVDWIWGTFYLFRKSDLIKFPNNKLHDQLFMYGEDILWSYYFKRILGKKIIFLPQAKVLHYIGGSSKNVNSDDKLLNVIIPSKYNVVKLTRGLMYAKIYILILLIKYFSILKKSKSDFKIIRKLLTMLVAKN